MKSLEHKIPPPLVALTIAVLMWLTSLFSWVAPLDTITRLVPAIILLLIGNAVILSGVYLFHKKQTTVNPLNPEKSTGLVTEGIYRYTRNPMYLGMVFILLAWWVWLAAPLAFIGPLIFAGFIGRFQIIPEERAMEKLFGKEFEQYRNQVRRWL